MRPAARRVLLLWIAAIALAALAGAWLHRILSADTTPGERAREQAEQIRERVHDLTH